ncbi:phenazine biosynthesis protein PhzF [Pseudoalteromonas sp. A25]|uniref:PhzF family phenazine biosynthesis protein n=1 Tax=Pseudoalteromonas sp. A25 TaxID=116092 RepID=UPI0012605470|nr:PhzF family phenazine biosynthesis protein [Pseudoalteromonas sp. A25]BBN82174.1 phenazine biosynthesis protein PhzF [Pseudoalteromonas sp. A25]
MKIKIDIIDAFTDTRFSGNSAAVVITDTWLADDLMQSIATENNLSETAFLVKRDEQYHIRWFSPLTEIDFCGHATLAASYVIFSRFPEQTSIVLYAQAVGTMVIEKSFDGRINMDFPNRMPQEIETAPEQLFLGLSIKPAKVLKNKQAYFAIYDNEQDVLAVTQDKEQLMQLGPLDVVVSALSNGEYEFVSRYFWPANGGDEDPVTGSIHTGLAPYWAQKLGKTNLVAYQASKRGGVVFCEIKNDRVVISGHAVRYLNGTIDIH